MQLSRPSNVLCRLKMRWATDETRTSTLRRPSLVGCRPAGGRKRYEDAERVYRAELADHPHNGWSLFGLQTALEAQAKSSPDVNADLSSSWARSDTWLSGLEILATFQVLSVVRGQVSANRQEGLTDVFTSAMRKSQ